MVAHYDDYNEDFRVDLWEEGKGLMLHLDHEYDYVLDSEQREALEPAISRYERDRFLDAYYSLFGPLAFWKSRHKNAVTVHGYWNEHCYGIMCRFSVSLLRRNRSPEYRPATGGTARCNFAGSSEAATRAHE